MTAYSLSFKIDPYIVDIMIECDNSEELKNFLINEYGSDTNFAKKTVNYLDGESLLHYMFNNLSEKYNGYISVKINAGNNELKSDEIITTKMTSTEYSIEKKKTSTGIFLPIKE